MIEEAINKLEQLATAAHDPQLLHRGRHASKYSHEGKIIEVKEDPKARKHKAGNLQTIFEQQAGFEENASVWHFGNAVILLLDDQDESDREDRVFLELTTSDKWNAATLQAKEPRNQKDFLTFLKQNLRDEVTAASGGLLASLAKITFRVDTTGEGSVSQGRESMGKAIKSEVLGIGEFPETIILKIRRWSELEYSARIEFALIIDTENQRFALKPLADAVKLAEIEAQVWLGEQITAGVKCPVYFGTP